MVNYYIYAKDFSASTHRDSNFHTNGLITLQRFKNDVEFIKKKHENAGNKIESKIIYLHWGWECEEVSEETTRRAYHLKIGRDYNTLPETIIDWLQCHNICGANNKIKLLYIITDGRIDERQAKKCSKKNQFMNYEIVVFHAFNNEPKTIDLSVAASFFKVRCVAYKNGILYDDTNILNEYDYDKIDIDNFAKEKDKLKSYIKLKFLDGNKHNLHVLQEIEKLKKLRARLFKELSSTKQQSDLETKDKSVFLKEFASTDWYRNIFTEEYDMKVNVEKSIGTLINYIVSDVKSYSFDALKFEKTFKNPVEEEQFINVNFTTEQEISFPDIILDDDKGIPVIILAKLDLLDKIIFHGKSDPAEVQPASFSKFKSAMECPLFLLNDRDVSESIGYFYTLNVYKQFLAKDTHTEPRTRRPFHGGLVLTETDAFDKYNDYIISATYFDFKKVNYNVGLFYYVLWKNCENKEWMDRNVVERFKEYTMRRISGTVCRIGLSSLPLDPPQNTSLLTALWYCVELSSSMFKHDPQNFTHERLRMFYGVAYSMIEFLKHFEYDLDLTAVETRRELLSHVMTLKKIPNRRYKVYYLLEKIFKSVDGFLVSEIENPQNLYKLNYLTPNHKEMLQDDVIDGQVHLNDYIHLMHHVDDSPENTYDICKQTFRPYFTVDQNKSFYTELVNNSKKAIISNDDNKDEIKVSFEPIDSLQFNRIMSLYNLYIKCVIDMEKYPTYAEYVEYISAKKKFQEDLVTIFPSNIHSGIKDVYDCYQKVVCEVDVGKFVMVTQTYVGRIERIKAEERVKFENEDRIIEFIRREESRVNLIKRVVN